MITWKDERGRQLEYLLLNAVLGAEHEYSYVDDGNLYSGLRYLNWPAHVAIACTWAALLCRAADIAYDKGTADGYDAGQNDRRWSGVIGNGYPERQP